MSTQSITRMTPSWKILSTLSVLAASLLPLAPVARAQSIWTGASTTETTGNWSDGANWQGGTAPAASGATLQFAGTTQTTTYNDVVTSLGGGNSTIFGITFGSTAGAYTLGGNALAFSASGNKYLFLNQSASNQTINNAITISNGGDNRIAFASGAGSMTFNGAIAFGGRLWLSTGDVSGSVGGTIVLNGANTGIGNGPLTAFALTSANGTAINGGTVATNNGGFTLSLGNATALGAGGVLNNGGGLTIQSNTNLTGANAVGNVFLIGNNGSLTIGGTNNIELSGTVNTLTNGNNTAGNNTVTGAAGAIINTGGNRTLNITNTGSTLISGKVSLSDNQTTGYTLTVNVGSGAGSTTISGSIVDYVRTDLTGTAGGFTKSGSGLLTLSGTNAYTGTTTISGGTLAIGGSGTLGGGSYAGAISNSGTFNYGSSAAQTLSGAISGSGSLIQSGTGPLTLSGNSSYTGSTTVNAGTLVYNGATLATTGSTTVASGATLTIGSGGAATSSSVAAGRIFINSGATLNGNGTLTLADTSTSLTSVSVSGTFSPGVNGAIGTFTLNAAAAQRSAWSFETGATLQFALGAGVTSSQMAIVGNASLSYATVIFNNNAINFIDLTAGNLATGNYLLIAGDANTKYSGLTTGASYTGSTVTGTAITGGLSIGTGLAGYSNTQLFLANNDIYLQVTASAIPEPRTYAALVGLGALGLAFWRRRRKA